MLLMEIFPKLDVSGIFLVTKKPVNINLAILLISVQFSIIAGM